jgi:FimV-like protein
VAPPAAAANDPIEAEFLAILARNPSSKRALMGLAAHYAERKNVRGFDEIAQRIYRLSSGRGPNWVHVAALGRQLDPDNPLFALEAGATNEDVLSETSETELPTDSTADVLEPAVPPAEPPQPPVEHPGAAPAIPVLTDVAPPETPITEGPSSGETLPEAEAAHQAAPVEAATAPEVPPDQSGSTPAPELEAAPEPRGEATLPPEAVAALGGLDLGLPPRIEGEAERAQTGFGEPEQAHEAAHDAAHEFGDDADEAPIAPTPAHAESPLAAEPSEPAEREPTPAPVEPPARPAVSGLGAAPVGPLKLSFNLDLPGAETGEHEASAAGAPLPPFTPEQLAKIARNKLDLASEYIALGDLGGARTLIHEVIESNDAATRDEAHALLATLAPLS